LRHSVTIVDGILCVHNGHFVGEAPSESPTGMCQSCTQADDESGYVR